MSLPRLLVLTDRHRAQHALTTVVEAAVTGGARAVVLREKDAPDGERRLLAGALRRVLDRALGVLLVASDGPVPTDLPADGVHLSAAAPWPKARPALVGRSCHDERELGRAATEGADYVTVSPVYPTESKPGATPLSVDGLARLCSLAPMPVFALGGVTANRARECVDAGAYGLAVIGAVMAASDPAAATAELLAALPTSTKDTR